MRLRRSDKGVHKVPVEKKLEAGSPWVELTTTDADWKAADPQLLMNIDRKSVV